MTLKTGKTSIVTSAVAHTQARSALRADGVTVKDTTAKDTMRATQTPMRGATVRAWIPASGAKPIAL